MNRVPDDLVERVRRRLAGRGELPGPVSVAAALRAEGLVLADVAVLDLVENLQGEIAGLGVLEPLLRDQSVTDLLVNAHDQVWVDRGRGLEKAPVVFRDDAAVRRLAQRLAGAAGRRLDDSTPYVDARLPNGIRLHAILPPISRRGVCLSLRIPRRRVFALEELVRAGSLPPDAGPVLRALVDSRVAFLVVGGTGTGKTTLLNTLLSLVPHRERIVIVEDSAELQPDHPHVVSLESRPANVEGAGTVTLRDLVRQALRMRPDRLVVGEVRGAEVVDLLAALNTGHEGGCGTLHANGPEDVPARLEALAMPAGMQRAAVQAQAAAGLEAVVHLSRGPDGRRLITGIDGLHRDTSGGLVARPVVRFDAVRTTVPADHDPLMDRIRACLP